MVIITCLNFIPCSCFTWSLNQSLCRLMTLSPATKQQKSQVFALHSLTIWKCILNVFPLLPPPIFTHTSLSGMKPSWHVSLSALSRCKPKTFCMIYGYSLEIKRASSYEGPITYIYIILSKYIMQEMVLLLTYLNCNIQIFYFGFKVIALKLQWVQSAEERATRAKHQPLYTKQQSEPLQQAN